VKQEHLALCVAFGLFLVGSLSSASDACSTDAIRTAADVHVSDGTDYKTETVFHSAGGAAIRFLGDELSVVAVEGPVAWTSTDGTASPGEAFHGGFAMGHQVHALLLHFEQQVENVRPTETIRFNDAERSGLTGDYPHGGLLHLIEGESVSSPAGLLLEAPDGMRVEMRFSDWRELDNKNLPYLVQIYDGQQTFDYTYTKIELATETADWFYDQLPAPDLDRVQIYRLHRTLLLAHCLGDADLMGSLMTAQNVIAGRGELTTTTPEETKERFSSVFDALDYTGYHDLTEPQIEFSAGDGIGWIAVEVRAVGTEKASGETFDSQWAWIMLVKEIDGTWLHAGNASNRKS